jgi:hypothetical protein
MSKPKEKELVGERKRLLKEQLKLTPQLFVAFFWALIRLLQPKMAEQPNLERRSLIQL